MTKNYETSSKFAFLNDFENDRETRYKTARWLMTEFDEPIWNCVFEERSFTIDFRIRLEDSTLLTEAKNITLLKTLKYWLCLQSHPEAIGTRIQSSVTAYYRVILTLAIIDYFLLNSSELGIARFGLQAITASHLKGLLRSLADSPSLIYSVYQWDKKLAEYCKLIGKQLSQEDFTATLSEAPWISEIEDTVERMLDLSDEQLIRARAYLWKHQMYLLHTRSDSNYRYRPNSRLLTTAIYTDTLWGKKSREVPEELCLIPLAQYQRERLSAPIRNYEDGLTDQNFSRSVTIVRTLGLLSALNIPIPHTALNATADKAFLHSLDLRNTRRFRTLPQNVVSTSLRFAIEFSLEFGDDLVASYLNLVRATQNAKLVSLTYFSKKNDISTFLLPSIRQLGVKYWSLEHQMLAVESDTAKSAESRRPSSNEFFKRFRLNEGLYELLCVLYGSVQICVGALMARRQGELNEVMAADALDESRQYLIFRNRKTGILGRRIEAARPLPNIAARLIGMLQSLQNELLELRAIDNLGPLFAMPHAGSIYLRKTISSDYSLNRFCDYFQVQLDHEDRRYYIRQHQLRRYFAMMFFWGSSFGGVETLQWFLGHADPEHLYRYITESIPGAALTSVKAAYAADLVVKESLESTELADLLERHFGTRSFSVLDHDELEEYIVELLTESCVSIEPQFYTTKNGRSYKVAIIVRENRK